MSSTSIEFQEAVFSITQEIMRMPAMLESQEKKVLNQCGKIIKKGLQKNLNRSNATKNYDGTTPRVHMKDDIKTKVKKSSAGIMQVTISGGKYTGHKWHMVNDGTRNKDGTVHTRATHFIDKTMTETKAETEAYIDKVLSEVANGNST